ncbi:hypothetical protein BU24DRAFT_423584 [Aaosphaeria arxii CBS 175.79]|uniref:Uncharacterized protein n=1 Tax=Aaosphaeria arxii CBS 175.79 TaxID=1450172 RepID=A0A6A5XP53_9PLEO|nr:uncharacterized protein BU24DRAFT_423584 [Aaosphaeria arxii CBS 175.79]KAF2014686.1 hypothetical protein BU24DRAFT_423584 [Aaosphaeria arxii CBS 175.79]
MARSDHMLYACVFMACGITGSLGLDCLSQEAIKKDSLGTVERQTKFQYSVLG